MFLIVLDCFVLQYISHYWLFILRLDDICHGSYTEDPLIILF